MVYPNTSDRDGRDDATPQPVESLTDPHRLANLFLDEYRGSDGLRGLHRYRAEFHEWSGTAYRVLSADESRSLITSAVKREFDRLNAAAVAKWERGDRESPRPTAISVTRSLVGNVEQAVASLCLLRGVEQPAWLCPQPPFPATEALAARNGIANLPALLAGRSDCIYPKTPAFFNPAALDFDIMPNAPPPVEWLRFLNQLWPSDPQSIEALQEWLGLLLTPDTRRHKILLLVGPPRSGKGTIARVLRSLVGPGNYAGPTLSSLAQNFGLSPLLGKTVAVVSDARLSGRTDTSIVVERLLAISGEDAVTIDRKHRDALTEKLSVRFVLVTNELPKLSDVSGALASRFIIVRLTNTWLGREDPTLTDRLLGELPGILLWACKGWERQHERGSLLQPDSGRELVAAMDELASPTKAFIREVCTIEPGRQVVIADLYDRWRAWCTVKGRAWSGDELAFGRDIHAAVPHVRRVRVRLGGQRVNAYDGIGLTDRPSLAVRDAEAA